MKVILNKCFGGFGLSYEAHELYANKKGLKLYKYKTNDFVTNRYYKVDNDDMMTYYFTKDYGDYAEIDEKEYDKTCLYLSSDYRFDKDLIEIVEKLGDKANGKFAELEVVEIPDNSFYKIDEYDGVETIYYSESQIKEK